LRQQQEDAGMKESARLTVTAAFLGVFLSLSLPVFAANIVVPSMELITHGYNNGGVFALQTFGDMTMEIQGGYKFGGSLSFNVHSSDLENLPSAGTLSLNFLTASINIKDLFSLPLSFSYFVGQGDTFGSGDGFALFGASPIMTTYRGFLYFPTGPLYDGIYQVQGTGARIEFVPKVETMSMDLYLYEDTHAAFTTPANYSGDFRFLLNFPAIKLEGFLGATYLITTNSLSYRGGLLFYATNRNVEFLAQIGIPEWDTLLYAVPNIDLFYLLVEPRLHLGLLSIVPTFFWHPGYYMQQANSSELGSFDVNLNLTLGDLSKSTFEGGLEGNIRVSSSNPAQAITFKASPWVGFSTPGVLWTIKVNARLWPFDVTQLFDAFVGVRAEF
jgi:hypothetical protein